MSAKRAVIAIGVNRTSSAALPSLDAWQGAKDFADWARDQRFDTVKLLPGSAEGKVTLKQIKNAVGQVVKARSYSQLIVYFSGHGVLKADDWELWLLSGAPADADEAVNASRSELMARNVRIPHVIFISDACRSLPNTGPLGQINGGVIFPTEEARPPRPVMDRYYAALPFQAAYEADTAAEGPKGAKRRHGVFSKLLMKGLRGEVNKLIEDFTPDGPIRVVPSWQLKTYLEMEVPREVARVDPRLKQNPEVRVESRRPQYVSEIPLGILLGPGPSYAREGFGPPAPLESGDELGFRSIAGDGGRSRTLRKWKPPKSAVQPASRRRISPQRQGLYQLAERHGAGALFGLETGISGGAEAEGDEAFAAEMKRLGATARAGGAETGFVVAGAEIKGWVLTAGMPSRQTPTALELTSAEPGSALIEFADGSGALLPVLPNYVATIIVDSGRVANVNFTSTQGQPNYELYRAQAETIDRCRAFVAVAWRRGIFQLDPASGQRIVDYLERLRGVDPAFELYATYAFARSGLESYLSRLLAMQRERRVVLFDLHLQAMNLPSESRRPERIVAPFCPVFTQGWALLDASGERGSVLREAVGHLAPAVWTTVRRSGMRIMREALLRGQLR